ncbi:hypothetical protein [Ferrimicrobium sp.]|uniref:hypothetical protein n=1 Tax=Ferrimicrobium sp. TaxID=2926050 RepID=UPI00260AC236|nr:hypothetical protein [Ferrimicrobium sp.]
MRLKGLGLVVLLVSGPMLLAACGATTVATPTTSPNATSATLAPVPLNGVTIDVEAASSTRPLLTSSVADLSHKYPKIRIVLSYEPPTNMNLISLEHPTNLRVFSVNPGRTLLDQLGGTERFAFASSTLYLSANLPSAPTVTLNDAVLIGILEGSITNWDNPLIASANPHLTLPNLGITVNPLPASGQRVAILERELAVPATSYGATFAPHCTTTPGCLHFSLTKPAIAPFAVDATSGQASLPSSAQYPLTTNELAVITTDPAHPREEAAAVRITQSLVQSGNLPTATRTSEEASLNKLLNELTIEHYANDPAHT